MLTSRSNFRTWFDRLPRLKTEGDAEGEGKEKTGWEGKQRGTRKRGKSGEWEGKQKGSGRERKGRVREKR